MSRSSNRNRRSSRAAHAARQRWNERHTERRMRWSRALLMGSTGLGGVLAGLALGAGSAWSQIAPNTLPTGGQVTAGSATINQANPSTLNINQSTDRAVINWSSFDVGSNASVNFYQPNSGSWTLNRVTNSIAPSTILGNITANGNIAVINPNGVIFGAGSRIDVNGLIATTANITDQNFMSGNMTFDQAGNPTASVSNFGDITVKDAGLVAFVAPGVSNSGTITARLGTVSLAAGQRFTIDLYGDKLVSIATNGAVDQAPIGPDGKPMAALVDNSGRITADGGQVLLTARQASRVVDTAINMSGVVQAQSAYVAQNGDIVLDGGSAGDVKVTGTLDASGKAPGTKGGQITVAGKNDVIVGSTATLDASGDAGGGTIKIGGDLHGGGTTPTAKRTLVATGAQVKADAVNTGKGGTIVVWSDENTQIGGMLSAQGGVVSGDGGLIETSSKGDFMIAASTDIRLNAPNGIGGTWLLDPQSIIIAASGPSGGPAGTTAGNDQFSDNGTTNTILASTIQTALGSGNVTLQATNDITMNSGTSITTASTITNSLTMQAGRDVTINGTVSIGGSFTATANDHTAGSSFTGGAGGNNGRKDSTAGDFTMGSSASITASAITITVDSSTGAITFSSGGPLAYNPGSVDVRNLTATGGTLGNVVINATSSSSNVSVNGQVQGTNDVTFNVGGKVSLAANLLANSDSANGGTLSGTSTQIYVVNNTAQVQDGIDIAGSGGSVTLAAATTWNEAISINKSLTLRGTSGTSTIDASSTSATAVLAVNNVAADVTVDGVSFVGDNSQANGINVVTAHGITILSSNVRGVGSNFTGAAITMAGIGAGGVVIDGAAGGNTVSGAAGAGIVIDPAGPVSITDMFINNVVGDGISIDGVTSGGVFVARNTINNTGGDGIHAADTSGSSGVTIWGNTLASSGTIGGKGIEVTNTSVLVSVSGNTIGSGALVNGDAILIVTAGSATVSGNTIGTLAGNVGGSGVNLKTVSGSASVSGNTVSGISVEGMTITGVTGTLNVIGNIVNHLGTVGNGIHVGSVGSVTISGNTVTGQSASGTGNGIFVDSGASTISGAVVSNNRVSAFGGDGILVDPVFGPTVIGNNVFNVGGNGIEITGASGNVSVLTNTVNATGARAIYLHDQTGSASDIVSIAGNTIGNDNTFGNVGSDAVYFNNNTGFLGKIHVDNNRIGIDTDGAGGATVASVGGSGILAQNATGQLTVAGNTIAHVAGHGIYVPTGGSVTVSGNTIDLTSGFAVWLSSVTTGVIANNLIGQTGTIGGFGGNHAVAVQFSNSVTASGNTIDNAAANGIYFEGVTSGVISGNRIGQTTAVTGWGVVAYQDLGNITISGNSIDRGNGILVEAVSSAVVSGNTIGAIASANYGVVVLHFSAVTEAATLAGNTVINPNTAGIYIHDTTSGGIATVTFGAGNSIVGLSGSADGLVIDGTHLAIGGATPSINDMTFQSTGGWAGNYVKLLNGALDNQLIDGRSASYDGIVGSAATPAQVATIEGKIIDVAEDSNVGDIVVNNSLINVDGGGLQAIQDGLDFGNGAHVFVAAGTYGGAISSAHSTDNALTIWADDVTLLGSGAPQLSFTSATGANAVVISGSGATFSGFEVTDTSNITSAVILVSGADARVTDNTISVGVATIDGILIQASGALIDGNSILGLGASGTGRGIVVDSGAGTLDGIQITNNLVDGFGGTGILIDPVFGPSVVGNTVINVGGNGIEIVDATGNVTVLNNSVGNVGGKGVYVHGVNDTSVDVITIGGNVIGDIGNTIGGTGIDVEVVAAGGTIGGNSLAGVYGDGIYLSGSSAAWTISDNSVSVAGVGSNGIHAVGVSNLAITDNFFAGKNLSANGIYVDSGSATLTNVLVSGNSVTGFSGDGILIDPVFGPVVIGNTISDVGGNGIEVSAPQGGVTITGNVVNSAALNAIYVHDAVGIGTDVITIGGNTIGNDDSSGTIGGGGIVGDNNGGFAGDIVVSGNRISIDTDGAGTLTPAAVSGSGISLVDSGGGVTVSGNTIANPLQSGITIYNAAGQVDVGINGVSGSGLNLIDIRNSDGGVSVHGNVLANSLDNGIAVFASSTVDIVGNSTTNISGTHIFVHQVNGGGLVIAGNTLTTGGGDAIRLEGNISGGATIGAATVGATTFAGNTASGFNFTAIDVVGSIAGDLSINGNTIVAAHDGIQSTGTVTGNVLVDSNTIDNITANGITVSGVGGTLVVTDNRIASVLAGSTVGGNAISATDVIGGTTIGGNHIGDNSGTGGIGGIGIAMTGLNADVSVSGNTIGDSDSTIGANGISISGAIGAASVTIEANTVVNFGAAGAAAGIYVADIAGPGEVRVYSNRIHDGAGDGIYLSGDSFAFVGAPGLGNIIDNVGGNGIYSTVIGDLQIDSNLIGTSGTIAQNGITVSGGGGVSIVNNTVGYDSTGTVVVIGQNGIAVQNYSSLTVSGNTIGGGTTNDSRIGGTGIAIGNGMFAGVLDNTISNTGYTDSAADGIQTGNGSGFTIAGNSIFNVANNGIEFGAGGGDIVVLSNIIDNNHDARGTTIGNGIRGTAGAAATILSNTISDVAAAGVSISGVTTYVVVGVAGQGNTISNADGAGVHINGSQLATVAGNTIGGTPIGVQLNAVNTSMLVTHNSISVAGIGSQGITIGGTAPALITYNDIVGASAGIGIDTADGQFTIQNNNVNGFATGLHVAAGTTVAANNLVFENNFSGNTIGVDHEGAGIIQASGNYWGFVTDDASFQAYFAHNAVLGINSGSIDVTPFLKDGTDGNGATVGFVGNFHTLFVTDLGMQLNGAGAPVAGGRIQEAVNLIPAGPGINSIEIGAGTFLDNVVINRADITNLKLYGQSLTSTIIDGQVNSQAVISVTAISTAASGDLTLQDFEVTGTTGGSADGIVTSNINHVLVDGVLATGLTGASGFDFVGGSDIAVTGFSIGPNVGKDGISLTSVAGATIGNGVMTGTSRDGIRVLDSTGVNIGNGVSIGSAGRDGIRVQSDGPAATVSLGGVTITNATDNGVNIIAGTGNTATVSFVGGTSISNNVAGAFNAVRVQGTGALFTLPTPNGTTDLSLNIDTSDATPQNYFLLTNGAMGGTVTLGYDVNFIGLTGTLTSLQTYGLTAATLDADQIAALFQIEDHMVHAVDNTSLGLIRLIPDALFPTVNGGLNGVRNAILLSDASVGAQDTVFLQAGDYSDPSNLVAGGLNIDRNIRLVGAQAGVSAVTGGRDPTDAASETILDFASATISPNNGIRITDPAGGAGVVIDGVVVQVGANQGYGIRIDASAARDNISILNSFVRGSSGNNATGDGIQTAGGSNSVGNLTITGDVIEYFSGDGVNLANIDGLTLQNDLVRHVTGRGIDINGSAFATSLAGNTIVDVGLDGIRVRNATSVLVIDANSIDASNTGDGISVSGSAQGVTVSNNLIGTRSAATMTGNGIFIDGTVDGGVLVSGNSIATHLGVSLSGDAIHVQNTTLGGVTISSNEIGRPGALVRGDGIQVANTGIGGSGNVTVLSNRIQNVAVDGVFVDPTNGSVTVSGQDILNVGGNGIHVTQTGGKVTIGGALGNTVNVTGKNGIWVDSTGVTIGATPGTGGVEVSNNTIGNLGGTTIGSGGSFDAILVTDTQHGQVSVAANTIASGIFVTVTRDGIRITGTGGSGLLGDGDIVVQNNTIAPNTADAVGESAVFVSGTAAGTVSVLDNSIAAGIDASIGDDAIHVQDTSLGGTTVGGNTIGGSSATIDGNGIAVLRSGGDVTVDSNIVGVSDAQFAGNGILVDRTGGATGVFVTGNTVGDGSGVSIALDGIHVSNTTISAYVSGNTIGGGSIGDDAIEVVTTTMNVSVGGNIVLNASDIGIRVGGTGGHATVSGNTVNSTGNDAINVFNTGDGVLVDGNSIATLDGGSIIGNAIYVDQTTGGSVTVTGNSIGLGGVTTGLVDGIHVEDTVLGGVTVSLNTLGAAGAPFSGDGIEVLRTGTGVGAVGGVSIANNIVGTGGTSSAISGYGIVVEQTQAGSVTIAGNRVADGTDASIGLDGIRVINTALGDVVLLDNAIATTLGATVTGDAIHVQNTSIGSVTITGNMIGGAQAAITQVIGGDGVDVRDTGGRAVVSDNSIADAANVGIAGNGVVVNQAYGVIVDGNSIASGSGATIGANGVSVTNSHDNGVEVDGNFIATGAGSSIANNGVLVTNTYDGFVAVDDNSIATGAGATIGIDGVHVASTMSGASVTVNGNVIGNATGQVVGDGVMVVNTSAGSVTVDGNIIAHVGGFGVRIDATSDSVTVGEVGAGNTIDFTGNDGIFVSGTDGSVVLANGAVYISSNQVGGAAGSTIGGDGIAVVDTAAGAVSIAGNIVGSGARVMGDGIRVNNTSLGGVTVANNVVGSNATGAGVDNDGIQVSNTGLGVVLDGNSVTNVGFVAGAGRGIVIDVTGMAGNGDSSILNSTVSNTGGVGILAQSIGGNLLANVGSVSNAGDTGLRVNYAGNVTVSGFTVDGSGNHGVHLRNISGGTVSNDTIANSTNDGLRLSRTDTLSPSMSVTVGSVTIDGAGGAGLRLFDNDGTVGGGTIALKVNSGVSIAHAGTGLIVDGADTRNIGNSLNDMAFANITGDYIHLQNAGWYENDSTPNGPFNPTQIDATHVSFDGVVAGSLDPASNPADVTTLANLETRIFHFIDDPSLGLIRLQANSISLPTANGLNGIQLADYVSSNGDSIYLVAGTYGDPSDLVPGGLIIDKQISLVGWQNGVAAGTGGRDGATNESILDFAGAAIAPTDGIVIKESNVRIDGVVVLGDNSFVDGGIVVDTSVARSNIDIVNNYVHGTSALFATGDGILTSGTATVTGLNVSGNAVDFMDGFGININHAANLTVQNNLIGTAGSAENISRSGITINNSSFAAAVSGNVVTWAHDEGIDIVDTVGSVAVLGNSVSHVGSYGIWVDVASGGATISNNNLATIGNIGIYAVSIAGTTIGGNTIDYASTGVFADHTGATRVLDNSVTNTGGDGIDVQFADDVSVNGNTLSTIGGNGILATTVGATTIANNRLDHVTDDGIDVTYTGNAVVVSGNTLSTIGGAGIFALSVGSTTIDSNRLDHVTSYGIIVENSGDLRVDGNVLSTIGNTGIYALSVGNTTIDNNALDHITGEGVFVEYAGDVVANGNTLSTVSGNGIYALSIGNTTIDDNRLDHVGGNGIFVQNGDAVVANGNTLSSITSHGIYALSVGNTTIDNNRLDNIGGNGIFAQDSGALALDNNTLSTVTGIGIYALRVNTTTIGGNTLSQVAASGIRAESINGDLSVLGNSLDGIGGSGIEASTVFGEVTVSNNRLHNVTATGITTSNTGDVEVNGNSLDLIGANGIVVSTATSNAVVLNNSLAHIGANGILVGQLTDATIANNVLSSITGTGIAATQIVDATVTGNSLSDIGSDGINLSQAHDLIVGANQMARVTGDGIDLALVNDVTVVGNILNDTGHGAGGAAVRLDHYTMATIVGNSIVSLTAMTGITISNGSPVAYPLGNTTIAGNIITGNQVGIYTSGEVLGTITGNTITGNSQWGIVVGTGLTETHLDKGLSFLDLLVTGNTISGNGTPMDHTLLTGGVRNDNIGLVLDARGNDWGDASGPYAGPTHFNQPNPGGKGNAVSDWVLYDIPQVPPAPPIVPPFGSLLDSFERGGGHPHTPGDVLAIGPGFSYNGSLFDPYFVDLFTTTFALAEAQGGGNAAIDYAVCYLGNMWSATSCSIKPGSLQ